MQIQAAMGLPMRRVSLSRDTVYNLLAWLKRNKAKASPRAIRFELLPGRAPSLVLEPWERRIESYGAPYDGPSTEPIRIWGRRRLLVLSRLLPLVERFDVYLLGTGLPSFWVAQLGDMRLTLGLSGWTTNDWTRGSALDLLSPPSRPDTAVIARIAEFLRSRQAAGLEQFERQCLVRPPEAVAALNHLAHAGQVIYDLDRAVYRWRQVMPRALGEAELGPENAEQRGSREILSRRQVKVAAQQETPGGGCLIQGQVEGKPVEVVIDADGRIKSGKCNCSHHYKAGIRTGPCRHLLALCQFQQSRQAEETQNTNAAWYQRLARFSNN